VLLWFAVVAPIIVAEVFRSPLVDYRLVALGAVLPTVEVAIGRPLGLHTLVAPVLVLAVVMATTARRRLVRRRLLGVPIGLFLHLVLDGTWTSSRLFWWPAFGWSIDREALPEVSGPPVILLLLDLAAAGLAVWAWRRYELGVGGNRRRLLRDGHLARGVV
jgi:hypothetical protein